MICKELMVGDWVATEHGFPMQVVNVGDDYAYATFEGNEGDPWELYDRCCPPNPIPITEGLLTKNGYNCNRPFDLCGIYFQLRENSLHIYRNDGENDIPIIAFHYIHEFQQLLRLAGMTDLANNFKI